MRFSENIFGYPMANSSSLYSPFADNIINRKYALIKYWNNLRTQQSIFWC
jgi:hypothetical protein